MDLGIRGKVALVTGAAGGLGRAIVAHLLDEGCVVAALDRDAAGLRALPEAIFAVLADLSYEEQIAAAVEKVQRALGDVDILVNNAGVQSQQPLAELTWEHFERVLRVNLTAAFALSRLLLPRMKTRGWGRIINMGSMAGKIGGLTTDAAYVASKAGLMGLTKSLARAGAPCVTVNALAPAFIATEMTAPALREQLIKQIPVGRLGTPEEIAAAVAFLASEWAGYITGEILDVNGGVYMD